MIYPLLSTYESKFAFLTLCASWHYWPDRYRLCV